LIATMIGLFGILILVSPALIDLFFPGQYAEAQRLLPVLLVAVLLPTIAVAATTYLLVAHEHGQKLFAGFNVAGFVLGLGTMSALVSAHRDVQSVAWGYVLGSSLVGVAPLAVVWRSDRHRWTWPTLRALAGAMVILLGHELEVHRTDSLAAQVLIAAAFALVWGSVSRHDLRTALAQITGRDINVSATPPSELDAPST
jgi:O-antigen/teichoic acid export membrane protein